MTAARDDADGVVTVVEVVYRMLLTEVRELAPLGELERPAAGESVETAQHRPGVAHEHLVRAVHCTDEGAPAGGVDELEPGGVERAASYPVAIAVGGDRVGDGRRGRQVGDAVQLEDRAVARVAHGGSERTDQVVGS